MIVWTGRRTWSGQLALMLHLIIILQATTQTHVTSPASPYAYGLGWFGRQPLPAPGCACAMRRDITYSKELSVGNRAL